MIDRSIKRMPVIDNMTDLEILKVFDLGTDYSLSELEHAYKLLVAKHCPEVGRGKIQSDTFKYLSECFKYLHKVKSKQAVPKKNMISMPPQTSVSNISKDNFNIDLFNKLFDKHRNPDPLDKGYTTWDDEEAIDNTIVGEPKPMASSEYYELGAEWNDFGQSFSLSSFTPAYTDFKAAYNTKELVDLEKVSKRKEYGNVDELLRDRENMSIEMTPDELKLYNAKLEREELDERKRLYRLQKNDNFVYNNFTRTGSSILNQIIKDK